MFGIRCELPEVPTGMKMKTVALVVAIVIVAAGVVGVSSIYLSKYFADILPGIIEDVFNPEDEDHSGETGEQPGGQGEDGGGSAGTDLTAPDKNVNLSTPDESSRDGVLSIPEIAALNSDCVVEIYTESVTGSGRLGQYVSEGAGSGIVITESGYIITNNHVIEGSRKITVQLNDGTEYNAELVGRDSRTDIAVVRINTTGLSPVTFGNSDMLVVGELAVAIGNPLGKLGGTVTEGIISALSRSIEIDGNIMTLLQTTAAVNPGNSGGGLFNNYGELIGVVNAKSSGSDIEGLGFAIPANLARTIAEALIQNGYVPGRIEFGVTLVDVPDQLTAMMYRVSTPGVYVSRADPDHPLQAGDRIVSIDGSEVNAIAEVNELLDMYSVGDTISITIVRNNRTISISHTLRQARS